MEICGQTHFYSVLLGVAAILFLIYAPKIINSNAIRERVRGSGFILKALPLVLVIGSIALVYSLHLQQIGIKTVGEIPSGFPPIQFPEWNAQLVLQLLPGAAMIAMISFVESLSIAQATALQQRSHLNSNQELIALGLANFGAGVRSSFPVTGSLSRTAGQCRCRCKTPMAGVFTSIVICYCQFKLHGSFPDLPLAVWAETIICFQFGNWSSSNLLKKLGVIPKPMVWPCG